MLAITASGFAQTTRATSPNSPSRKFSDSPGRKLPSNRLALSNLDFDIERMTQPEHTRYTKIFVNFSSMSRNLSYLATSHHNHVSCFPGERRTHSCCVFSGEKGYGLGEAAGCCRIARTVFGPRYFCRGHRTHRALERGKFALRVVCPARSARRQKRTDCCGQAGWTGRWNTGGSAPDHRSDSRCGKLAGRSFELRPSSDSFSRMLNERLNSHGAACCAAHFYRENERREFMTAEDFGKIALRTSDPLSKFRLRSIVLNPAL